MHASVDSNVLLQKTVMEGSSFYNAMCLAPPAERAALFEVYGYLRIVDDIADGVAPREEKIKQLKLWRERLHSCYEGSTDAAMLELRRHIEAFAMPREDFDEVIDGVMMDAAQDIRMPDWDSLRRYCEKVAGATCRLLLHIVGMPGSTSELSLHAGQGLQLTNILRDIDEDLQMGRMYIPRELVDAYCGGVVSIEDARNHRGFGRACLELHDVARLHLEQARNILARLSGTAFDVPHAMIEVYQTLLQNVRESEWR